MDSNRQKFYCDFPGCNRSYLRSEHLNRHSLIHKKGAFVCYLCQRRFTRNDLLNAHLRRHEKRGHDKDAIAKNPPETANPASNGAPAPAEIENSSLSDAKSPQSKDWSFAPARFSQSPTHPPSSSAENVPMATSQFSPPLSLPPPRPDDAHAGYQYPSPNDAVSQNSASSTNTLPPHMTQPQFVPTADPVDDYSWLFRTGSLFDLPPDDYLNLHFGDGLGVSPPGFYGPSLEQAQGPRDGSGFTIADHERLVHDFPSIITTPLKDYVQTNYVLLLALDYCDIYMPLFHRPTLEFSSCPSVLLLALCDLGLFLNNIPGSYETGRMLQKLLWSQTVEKALISPRVEMWFLQTLVIVEHICTYAMSRHEHEMAEIVHSIIVTLARRNNLMAESHRTDIGNRQSLEIKWKEWAQRESVIRVAHTIFVSDVQYMVYFSHHALLSVGLMKLPLPSHPSLWEASSALEWEEQIRQTKRSSRSRYHSLQGAVEALLSMRDLDLKREYLQRFNMSNPLSLHLLIHGIASAIGDLKYRAIASLSTPAIHTLRTADFDEALAHWLAVFDRLTDSERNSKQSWNALLMYHFSAVLLRNNLSEIQMAAGSAFSSGRAVTPQGAQAAYTRLVTSDPVNHDSYLHGLEIVSLCLRDVDLMNQSGHQSPARPLWQIYCAFLGILLLWAHALGLESLGKVKVDPKAALRPLPPTFAPGTAGETLGNMYERERSRSESDNLEVQTIKNDLRQLISTVSQHLTVRPWEISHEACKILTSLCERDKPGALNFNPSTLPSMMAPLQPSHDRRSSLGRIQ